MSTPDAADEAPDQSARKTMLHVVGEPTTPTMSFVESWCAESGLSASDLPNFRAATAGEITQAIGIPVQTSGALIEYLTRDGKPLERDGVPIVRARLEQSHIMADGSKAKYLSAQGSCTEIYFPKGAIAAAIRLGYVLIVEGEKKAERAMKAGIPAIGVPGIWNWTPGSDGKSTLIDLSDSGRKLHPDIYATLEELCRSTTKVRVLILYDSEGALHGKRDASRDALEVLGTGGKRARNPQVYYAAKALSKTISRDFPTLHVGFNFVPEAPGSIGEKAGLDDWLQRESTNDVLAALTQFMSAALSRMPGVNPATPLLVIPSDEANFYSGHALKALDLLGQSSAVYGFEGSLAWVHENPSGDGSQRKVIRGLNEASMQMLSGQALAIYQERETKERTTLNRVDLSIAALRMMLATDIPALAAALPRQLRMTAKQPLVDPSTGRLLRDGLDAETNVLVCINDKLWQDDFEGCDNPFTSESAMEYVQKMADEYKRLFQDVAFAEPCDLAAYIASLIAAAIRPMLKNAPMILASAPASSSGKSVATRMIAHTASGEKLLETNLKADGLEAEKQLVALMINNPAVVYFDEIAGKAIDAVVLRGMITGQTIALRKLGVSENVIFSTRVVVIGNVNNVEPSGDMARRVLKIRIDTGEEAPQTRRFRGDPEHEILADRYAWVMKHLRLVQAWLALPENVRATCIGPLQPVGFGEWVRVPAGIGYLMAAMVGFLPVLDSLAGKTERRHPASGFAHHDPEFSALKRMLDAASHDPEREANLAIIRALAETFGTDGEWWTTKQLRDHIVRLVKSEQASDLVLALSDTREATKARAIGDVKPSAWSWMLGRLRDKRLDGMSLRMRPAKDNKEYRIERGQINDPSNAGGK